MSASAEERVARAFKFACPELFTMLTFGKDLRSFTSFVGFWHYLASNKVSIQYTSCNIYSPMCKLVRVSWWTTLSWNLYSFSSNPKCTLTVQFPSHIWCDWRTSYMIVEPRFKRICRHSNIPFSFISIIHFHLGCIKYVVMIFVVYAAEVISNCPSWNAH